MTTLIDAWGDAMFRASWQGGAALLLVWIICAACRRAAPGVKCWLWRLGVLKFPVALLVLAQISLPLLSPPQAKRVAESRPPAHVAALPRVQLPTAGTAETTASPASIREITNLPTALSGEQPILVITAARATHITTPLAAPPAPQNLPQVLSHIWLPTLFTAWFLGTAICTLRLARAWARTRTLRRSATHANDAFLSATCRELAAQLHLRRLPEILITPANTGPLLAGILRPAILLPASLPAHSPPEQLRLILAHELAHLKRHDILWNLLQSAIDALFFFHPLIWLARRQSRHLQELACDDLTLAATQAAPAAYGKALLNVLALQQMPRRPLAGVGVADSIHSLRRRLLAMKNFQPATPRRALVAAVLTAITAAIGIPQWRVIAQSLPEAPPTAHAPATSSSPAGVTATDPPQAENSDKIITRVISIKSLAYHKPFIRAGFDPSQPNNLIVPLTVPPLDVQLKSIGLIDSDTKVSINNKAQDALTLTGKAETIRRLTEIIGFWEYQEALSTNEMAAPDGAVPAPIKPEDMPPRVLQFLATLDVPTVSIQSPVDGTLADILAKEGQTVHKGDVLFLLDDRAARAAEDIAKIKYDMAKQTWQENLAGKNAISRAQMAQTESDVKLAEIQARIAHDAVENLVIRSLSDGTFEPSGFISGQLVSRGANLATIVTIDDINVQFGVPAANLRDIHRGQKMTLSPEGEPPATAEIDRIATSFDQQSNTVQIRGKLISGGNHDTLKSGMMVNVYITADRAK